MHIRLEHYELQSYCAADVNLPFYFWESILREIKGIQFDLFFKKPGFIRNNFQIPIIGDIINWFGIFFFVNVFKY